MIIKKNDTVLVISGKDRGKKGKVRFAHPKEKTLIIEGINFIKRHARATRQARQAGVIELEAPVHISKVMLLCDKCNHPSRIGIRFLDDNKKVRYCKVCQEVID
jgi:large subunit ribosomal protein L24